MKTTDKTRVIFRKFPDGDTIALFPSIPGDMNPGVTCLSYQHVGQHGAACVNLTSDYTTPATPEEYAPLLAELRSLGYSPVIAYRATAKDYQNRLDALSDGYKFEFTDKE